MSASYRMITTQSASWDKTCGAFLRTGAAGDYCASGCAKPMEAAGYQKRREPF